MEVVVFIMKISGSSNLEKFQTILIFQKIRYFPCNYVTWEQYYCYYQVENKQFFNPLLGSIKRNY